MAIQFTNEQIALKELAQQFFENEVKPVMAELDARPNPRDCYPHDLVRKMSEIGLRTLALPEEYGGGGADLITENLVFTTMCEVEAGTGKIMSQCWKVTNGIAEAGTEEQKKKFLIEFAKDHDCVCSLCSSEPNAGSDNVSPYNAPPGAGYSTTAIPDGEYYILNGTKHMISLAGISKLMLVYTRTAPNLSNREGTTLFIVPSDLPGISYGQVHNKMGYRLYPNGEIFFDNVRIPKEFMLGKLNAGFETRAEMNKGNLETPASILGICKAIYRIVLDHARQRVQGGKPIIEHQAVGAMLSEIAMLIDTLEGYFWDIAYCLQNDPNVDRKKTRFGMIFSRDCMVRVILLGLDITASAGIMRDHPMEKLIRDGLSILHWGGTNSLLKIRTVPWLKNF